MNGDDVVVAMKWLRSTISGLVTGKGDARIHIPERHIRPLQVGIVAPCRHDVLGQLTPDLAAVAGRLRDQPTDEATRGYDHRRTRRSAAARAPEVDSTGAKVAQIIATPEVGEPTGAVEGLERLAKMADDMAGHASEHGTPAYARDWRTIARLLRSHRNADDHNSQHNR